MPLSDGRYDREHVLREPVVAWKIDSANYTVPVIPGLSVTDRWAVLTPEGYVFTDGYTNAFGEAPLALKDWIKSEIEWLEGPTGSLRSSIRPYVSTCLNMVGHSPKPSG